MNFDIVGLEEIAREIALDHRGLVARANHEIVQAGRRIELHHMPQDRPSADFDQGLGDKIGFSERRVPNPPARMTAFICLVPELAAPR